MNYRPEIDGLRAIAVLPVILFHAGLLNGGYVGVDIFFVISGYLITGILLTDMQLGKFSFAQFYERRARRILPALLLTTLICIPFAWYLMSPAQLTSFSKSILAVVFFVSNIFFCQEIDYFAAPLEFIPLLHTWSLAVEEQFYALFPLLLFGLYKFARSYIAATIFALGICSLILSDALSTTYENANFYLLPSRIWELMLGAILAHTEIFSGKNSSRLLKICMPTFGLLMIAFAIYYFDKQTPHPSLLTLIPTLGTAAIIWYAGSSDFTSQILSSRTLVGLGVISYSIYLWHQPILVFLRLNNLGILTPNSQTFFIPTTIFLAFLSWRYIEKPFRNYTLISSKVFIKFIMLIICVLVLISTFIYMNDGICGNNRVPDMVYASMQRNIEYPCSYRKNIAFEQQIANCHIGLKDKAISDFAIVGDSHAMDTLPAFRIAAATSNTNGIAMTYPGCQPALGYSQRNKNNLDAQMCSALNIDMFNYISTHKIKTVILVSKWFVAAKTASRELDYLQHDLYQTIKKYNSIGVKAIILLPIPKQNYEPIEIYKAVYLKEDKNRKDFLRELSISRQEQIHNQTPLLNIFKSIPKELLTISDATYLFCDEQKCMVGTLDNSHYSDPDHLGPSGIKMLIPELTKILLLTRLN